MEGMCYVLGQDNNVKWKPVTSGSNLKFQDFWEYSKKNLMNERLIKIVKDFKENKISDIKPESMTKLRALIDSELF